MKKVFRDNPYQYELKTHVDRARTIADQLRSTQHDAYLLHGDLHHENILQKGS